MWIERSTPPAWAYASLAIEIDGQLAGKLRWRARKLKIDVPPGEHEIVATLGVISSRPTTITVTADSIFEVVWTGLSTSTRPLAGEESLAIRASNTESKQKTAPSFLSELRLHPGLIAAFITAATLLVLLVLSRLI